MKKIVILAAISLFTASSAFAAGTSLTLSLSSTGLSVTGVKTGTAGATSPLIGKTSTGVGVGMLVDATAGAGYSLETQHKNGTKAFGSAFDSTSIYSKDVTAGTADTTGYGTTGSDAFGTGWTTM
jgi:hypothetical protein